MAEYKQFPEANFLFKAPEGSKDVGNLEVFRITDDFDNLQNVSCWAFSPEELEEIKRTGVFWISVLGEIHPPIAVAGFKPFEIYLTRENN